MKNILLLVAALLLCSCTWALGGPQYLKNISLVSYVETSGTVSDEFRWREEYALTSTKATFTRSGPPAAVDLNVGTWELDVAPEKIASLFDQLETIDRASIQMITPEPDHVRIGGGSQSYHIEYGDAQTLWLTYGDGTTYANGESVTGPIDDFIDSLTLPAGVRTQYIQSE